MKITYFYCYFIWDIYPHAVLYFRFSMGNHTVSNSNHKYELTSNEQKQHYDYLIVQHEQFHRHSATWCLQQPFFGIIKYCFQSFLTNFPLCFTNKITLNIFPCLSASHNQELQCEVCPGLHFWHQCYTLGTGFTPKLHPSQLMTIFWHYY